MTIFGGEETAYGLRKNGFWIVCCKCGWESKVEVYADGPVAVFKCHQCGNEHLE